MVRSHGMHEDFDRKNELKAGSKRAFGLVFAVVFTVIGFWPLVGGGAVRFWALAVAFLFALAAVVGGIDCTESAAAAGDEYDTGQVIGVEAFATLVAALCGGVIQTTPYIGHPAYKAMGGRAAYSLATALFIGSAGLLGYFGFLYVIIPKAAIFPILVLYFCMK